MTDRADQQTALADFLASVDFWKEIDDLTARLRPLSMQGRFFESVEFDTRTVALISGPSRAEDSDGYERIFAEAGREGWVLSAERRSRGRGTRVLPLGVFSHLSICAKYMLAAYVANSVREGAGASPNIQAELSSAPLPNEWSQIDSPPGSVATFVDESGSRIVCTRALSAVAHIAAATFGQINGWYASGIGAAEARTLPSTTT